MESTIYRIIDTQTGKQVGRDYAYPSRKRARTRAETLNQTYGAHRYSVRSVFNAAPDLCGECGEYWPCTVQTNRKSYRPDVVCMHTLKR